MQFKDIYSPISKELALIEKELQNMGENLNTNCLHEIIGYFFKIPGKRLRPILALLSSGIINTKLSLNSKKPVSIT